MLNEVLVHAAESATQGPKLAVSNDASVNPGNWSEPSKGAGYKGLISAIYIKEGKVLFKNRYSVFPANPDDVGPGDPIHTILTGGGPDLAVFYHKKISRITSGYEAMKVEH